MFLLKIKDSITVVLVIGRQKFEANLVDYMVRNLAKHEKNHCLFALIMYYSMCCSKY